MAETKGKGGKGGKGGAKGARAGKAGKGGGGSSVSAGRVERMVADNAAGIIKAWKKDVIVLLTATQALTLKMHKAELGETSSPQHACITQMLLLTFFTQICQDYGGHDQRAETVARCVQ